LVLQHDRHLFGMAAAQPGRDLDARIVGAEGHVEMVLARQACGCGNAKRFAHDAAQRVLHHPVVLHFVVRCVGHGNPRRFAPA